MKKTKVLALILAVCLAVSCFAGCSGNSGSTSGSSSAGGSQESSKQEASNESSGDDTAQTAVNPDGYPIMNEDYTFKVVHAVSNGDLVGTWENKEFSDKIAEDTGLKIEWVEISQNTYNDQVGILIAANDLPDVFSGFSGGAVPNFAQFTSSFIPLNDYIDEYCPAVVDFYENYPEIKAASVFPDGNMYGLPRVQMNNFRANNALFINNTWLEKLNLEAPNNTDELYNVLKAFKEQDANGNGDASDEFPLAFTKSESLIMYLSAFNIFSSPIDEFPYVMVEDGKVVFYPETDNYREFLEYMHKLYSEGLIDPNSFVQEEQDLQAKGKNGQVGVMAGTSYIDILVGDRANEYTYMLPLENKDGQRNYMPSRFSGDVVLNAFAITTKCEYPEAMLRFYDYLNSSYENRLYYYWGQEGTAWEKTDDGKILRLNAQVPEGYSNYAEVRHTLSMGIMGPILWNDEDQETFAITNDRDVEYYARQEPYMEYAIDEYIPVGQDTAEATSEVALLLTEIKTYIENFQAEAIMTGIDDGKWEQHLTSVKTFGADKYVEIRQEYYDRVMQNMN